MQPQPRWSASQDPPICDNAQLAVIGLGELSDRCAGAPLAESLDRFHVDEWVVAVAKACIAREAPQLGQVLRRALTAANGVDAGRILDRWRDRLDTD